MNFNLKNTEIFQAIVLNKNPFVRFSRGLKKLFLISGLVLLTARFILIFVEMPVAAALSFLLAGLGVLFLSLGLLFLQINLFFEHKLKKPKLHYSLAEFLEKRDYLDGAGFLDLVAAKIVWQTLKLAKRQGLPLPSNTLLLYALLGAKEKEMDFVFHRAGLNRAVLKKQIKQAFLKKEISGFKPAIFKAAELAVLSAKKRIGLGDILTSLAYQEKTFSQFLAENDLQAQDIKNLVDWYERSVSEAEQRKKFWHKDNLESRGSLAGDFASGYTITIDRYSRDLRFGIKQTGLRKVIGHKEAIKAVERILNKEELNNALIVGEPGVGRKSIVRAIAQKAFMGQSLENVNYRRIVDFDLGGLLASAPSKDEEEALLEKCFSEVAEAGNVILMLDNFEEAIEIAPVLARWINFSAFQLIAITSYQGLHNILERRPAILNLFEKVEVKEISQNETLMFLEYFVPFFENTRKRFVSYRALREIVKLSSRYLTASPMPQAAFRLLDESMAYLITYSKDKILLSGHIEKVVSQKAEVPLGEVAEKEKQTLLNLEKLIHQYVINQEEAVKEVSSALRRARAEVNIRQGPMGSFLFLGPTGVGKTQTAKALARVYFGAEKRMIRLDMSEFQSLEDIKRLLGSSQAPGLLTMPIRENPFSLLLLDELEKAHPNILNLFLQVLDEGWITDGFGRRVDFRDTIIIATSNAGAELIRQDIKEDKRMDMIKEDLLDHLLHRGLFRPEFLNRFNAVVCFKPLSQENLLDIAGLLFGELSVNLKDKGIEFTASPDLKKKLVELSYSPEFGAREMKRVMQDRVENVLARAILEGRLKRGQKVEIEPENFNLIISKQY